jgi:hypothetical protein
LSKIADVRAKLTANVLNASAAGVFVTGVIPPLGGGILRHRRTVRGKLALDRRRHADLGFRRS